MLENIDWEKTSLLIGYLVGFLINWRIFAKVIYKALGTTKDEADMFFSLYIGFIISIFWLLTLPLYLCLMGVFDDTNNN